MLPELSAEVGLCSVFCMHPLPQTADFHFCLGGYSPSNTLPLGKPSAQVSTVAQWTPVKVTLIGQWIPGKVSLTAQWIPVRCQLSGYPSGVTVTFK